MEAEQSRMRSEAEHKSTAANYASCVGHMKQLEKKLKRSITKSKWVPPPPPLFNSPILLPFEKNLPSFVCLVRKSNVDGIQMFLFLLLVGV